jgi:Putative Ig domain/Beta-lactamase
MDSAKLNQLAAHLGGRGCVVRHGYLVKCWGDVITRSDWYSSMKPVLSTLLFFAAQEGKVSGVDAKVDPWWGGRLSAKDKSMTFRHLGAMTSGYARGEAPGAAYAYNDFASALYADTLFQKVFQQAAATALTNPQRLGALRFQDGVSWGTVGGWARYHLSLSPRDFARISWFWLNKGNWNGSQLLDRSFFDQYMKPQVPRTIPRSSLDGSDYLGVGTIGGGPNAMALGRGTYGFNWWFNASDAALGTTKFWPDAPGDTVMTFGTGGSNTAFIPSLDVVLVSTGANWGADHPAYNTPLKMLVGAITGTLAPTPAPTPTDLRITGPASLVNGTVGTAYSATFTATGSTPIGWNVAAGALPPGLTLAPSTGVYSGTPTTAGAYSFTVRASNAAGTDNRA